MDVFGTATGWELWMLNGDYVDCVKVLFVGCVLKNIYIVVLIDFQNYKSRIVE